MPIFYIDIIKCNIKQLLPQTLNIKYWDITAKSQIILFDSRAKYFLIQLYDKKIILEGIIDNIIILNMNVIKHDCVALISKQPRQFIVFNYVKKEVIQKISLPFNNSNQMKRYFYEFISLQSMQIIIEKNAQSGAGIGVYKYSDKFQNIYDLGRNQGRILEKLSEDALIQYNQITQGEIFKMQILDYKQEKLQSFQISNFSKNITIVKILQMSQNRLLLIGNQDGKGKCIIFYKGQGQNEQQKSNTQSINELESYFITHNLIIDVLDYDKKEMIITILTESNMISLQKYEKKEVIQIINLKTKVSSNKFEISKFRSYKYDKQNKIIIANSQQSELDFNIYKFFSNSSLYLHLMIKTGITDIYGIQDLPIHVLDLMQNKL